MKITKQIIAISILVITCFFSSQFNAFAQLSLNSSGKVGIGTTNAQYGSLEIATDGHLNGLSIKDPSKGGESFRLYRSNDIAYITRAGSSSRGFQMLVTGSTSLRTSNTGAYSEIFTSYSNYNLQRHYVVKNTSGNNTFYVNGDGRAWSNGYYLTSDSTLKENISNLTNAIDKVKKIRGVTYTYKSDNCPVSKIDESDCEEIVEAQEEKKLSKEENESIKYNKNKKRAGLLAQEVEQVLPEAVRMMPDGTKAVSYDELIPLLIEAVKEQQQLIEELKNVSVRNDSEQNSTFIGDGTLYSEALLFQNTPNPFSENCEIKYFLPEEVKSAALYVYNMNGNQIKSIPLPDKGEASITIFGSELQPGMYIYAMIADGIEIGTKRMILTE